MRGAELPANTGVKEPIIVQTVIDEEVHESFLKIVDRESREVVTVVEVLSPSNKHPGSYGLLAYRAKRQGLLMSQSHLVEIDLLRGGKRIEFRNALPVSDYLVHVSRVEERPDGRAWPIRLEEPLPPIPIPLRAPDADVELDVQQVLSAIYDRCAYDLEIDYSRDPDPQLTGETALWADRLLRDHGLRQ